jgi:hypothetical protein
LTPTPVVHEGFLHVYVVPAVARRRWPGDRAEIAAGVDLTPAITADGYSPNPTQNTVSTDMLTGFIKQSIGTEGASFDLTFVREKDTNGDVWDYFDERGKNGFLVVCPFGAAEAAQHAEVYPIEFARRRWVSSGANAHQKFQVMVSRPDDYNDDATIVPRRPVADLQLGAGWHPPVPAGPHPWGKHEAV